MGNLSDPVSNQHLAQFAFPSLFFWGGGESDQFWTNLWSRGSGAVSATAKDFERISHAELPSPNEKNMRPSVPLHSLNLPQSQFDTRWEIRRLNQTNVCSFWEAQLLSGGIMHDAVFWEAELSIIKGWFPSRDVYCDHPCSFQQNPQIHSYWRAENALFIERHLALARQDRIWGCKFELLLSVSGQNWISTKLCDNHICWK